MDRPTRAYYDMAFKAAFLERRGESFQDFFSSIMEKRYPGDFLRVRPWGNVGDRKNDGYHRSQRRLFQVYAPNEMTAPNAVAKIDEDFHGALPHWNQYFSIWIFVHNDKSGLSPQITEKLLALGKANPSLVVTSWGFEELLQETMRLSEHSLASLLGPSPFESGRLVEPGVVYLQKILTHIGRLPADPNHKVRPVPMDKLKYNQLSESVHVLLTAGMTRTDVVRRYFLQLADPAARDEIAEGFRAEYRRLKALGTLPDDIYVGLQRYVGGNEVRDPQIQTAVYAVLAFYFEECDIFERPGEWP